MNETDLYQSEEATLRSTSLSTSDHNNNTYSRASHRDSYVKKSLMDQLKTLLLNSLPHIAILMLFLLYSLIGATIFFEIENDALVANRNIYTTKIISKRTLVTNPKKQEYKQFINRLFKDHRIKVNQNMNKLISKYNQQDNSSKTLENSIPSEGLEYIEKLNLKNSNMKQLATNQLGVLLIKSNAEVQSSIKKALDEFYDEQKIFESKLADLFSKPEALMDHIDQQQQQQTCSEDSCQTEKRSPGNKKFLTSFHFIVASLFSIGYPGILPHTVFGKLFTMTYLVIGLPLTLIFLSDIGKLMTRFLNFMYTMYIILCIDVYYDQILKFFDKHNWRVASILYRALFSKIKRPKPQSHNQQLVAQYDTLARIHSVARRMSTDLNNNSTLIEHVNKKRDILQTVREIVFKSLQHSDNTFNFSFSFLALVSFVYLTLGALMIARMTNQSILDGYYFGVLTLTRIGSGDSHIQTNTQAVVSFLYVLFGMSFFSLTIKYLQEQIRLILLKNGQTIISEIIKFIDQFGYQLKTEDFNLTLSGEAAKFVTESTSTAEGKKRMHHQRSIGGEKMSRKPSVKMEVAKCDKQTQITTLLYSRIKYDGMNQPQSSQMTDMPSAPSSTTKKSNIEFCSTPTLAKQLLVK